MKDLVKMLDLPERFPKTVKECQIYYELRRLGARPMQANWKAKAICKWVPGKELSQGAIYSEMRLCGIDPIPALKIEVVFWAIYDGNTAFHTTYDLGFIQFLEGKKKNKIYYNGVKVK